MPSAPVDPSAVLGALGGGSTLPNLSNQQMASASAVATGSTVTVGGLTVPPLPTPWGISPPGYPCTTTADYSAWLGSGRAAPGAAWAILPALAVVGYLAWRKFGGPRG